MYRALSASSFFNLEHSSRFLVCCTHASKCTLDILAESQVNVWAVHFETVYFTRTVSTVVNYSHYPRALQWRGTSVLNTRYACRCHYLGCVLPQLHLYVKWPNLPFISPLFSFVFFYLFRRYFTSFRSTIQIQATLRKLYCTHICIDVIFEEKAKAIASGILFLLWSDP